MKGSHIHLVDCCEHTSRLLPYDACVLSDLAVKSSGIRASSDLWNVELKHAQPQGKTLWLAQFHTARITNQTTEAIKTYIKATKSISIGRWSFPYFPTCVGVKCWFFGYIFWYFPILFQVADLAGCGAGHWTMEPSHCNVLLGKGQLMCGYRKSVSQKKWNSIPQCFQVSMHFVDAFWISDGSLVFGVLCRLLKVFVVVRGYAEAVVFLCFAMLLLVLGSSNESTSLFKPAMYYGICHHIPLYTYQRSSWQCIEVGIPYMTGVFTSFFRLPTINPSKFGSFKLFSWRIIIIIYIYIYVHTNLFIVFYGPQVVMLVRLVQLFWLFGF